MGTIRKINFNDLDEINKLEKSIFSNFWSLEIIKSQIKHPESINLLLAKEMQILGYLFTRKYIDFVEIERIGVLSNKRRNYVGEKLIKKLEVIVTLEGINKITLEVREDNHSAISLYKKLGFNKDSIRKDYYQDKENAILMSKILD